MIYLSACTCTSKAKLVWGVGGWPELGLSELSG